MLSEAEQRRLVAIESGLRADDPDFVRVFTDHWRSERYRAWRGPAGLVAFLIAVTTIGVGLYLLSLLTTVIAVTVGMRLWISDRRRRLLS